MTRATWALGLSWVLLSCGSDGTSSTDGGRDAPQVLSENTAAMCQDGQDNDGDGVTDCADQDCWPLTFCAEERPDGWTPSADGSPADGGPGDSFYDAPYVADGATPADGTVTFDNGLQSCSIHYDCPQGGFCYKGNCLRDKKQSVYHCGKPGCPPGHWCLTQSNTKDRCAEDPSYVCQDACDCGPAHCCKQDNQGIGRCVWDAVDPWITGPVSGTPPSGLACEQGVDATYCCAAPSCFAGIAAYGAATSIFRCHNSTHGAAEANCGGAPCFGTACNCAPGESCADLIDPAPAGKSCRLLSGGSCLSNALAEAVLGWAPSELLPCCATGCAASGRTCDAGWRSGGAYAYARMEGKCGSCGNGICEAWESPEECVADCRCGDGVCSVSELTSCAADCGACGNGTCDALETAASCAADCNTLCGDGVCAAEHGETPQTCSADCPSLCADAATYPGVYRHCGDGVCAGGGQSSSACDWNESETCRTCPQDCPPCEWTKVHGDSPALAAGLNAVWVGGPALAFAVGGDGQIMRFDGAAWSAMISGTHAPLRGLWGDTPADVFAVGDAGTMLRFDGKLWHAMPSGTSANLTAVWGSSASAVIAVGYDTDCSTSPCTDAGLTVTYDGQKWTTGAPIASQRLAAVWGSSATDVFAVGSAGAILHYDGQSWQPQTSGTTAELFGVWGSGPANVFAVGSGGAILRYNGTGWKPMTSGTTQSLYAVWGSSASDVFAVGYDGTILHYGGGSWTEMPSDTKERLADVSGNGSTNALAVSTNGTIVRYDGSAWKLMATAATLHALWSGAANDVFAVGARGTILRGYGTSWSPMASGTQQSLNRIWGSGPSNVFALGDQNTIVRYDGTSWMSMASGARVPLRDIWGSGPTNVLVVGGRGSNFDVEGEILRFDGQQWSVVNYFIRPHTSIWGSAPDDIFVGGGACVTAGCWGTITHYDGASWTTTLPGTTSSYMSVFGTGPLDVYAAGGGTVFHYDGVSWQKAPADTPFPSWGTGPNDLFALGGNSIRHYDGQAWRYERADLREDGTTRCHSLADISGTPTGDTYVVGSVELVLQRCPAGACPNTSPSSPPVGADAGTALACPNSTCDIGESCDGRNATVSCPQDCPSANLGHPNKEYCFVNGVCVGPGCP